MAEALSKQKILSPQMLNQRPSRTPNYQLENVSLRILAKTQTLDSLVQEALKVCRADVAGVLVHETSEEAFAGVASSVKETLLISIAPEGEEVGFIWVALNSSKESFDFEDYRMLESLADAACGIIKCHIAIQLERDNLERVFNSTPSASAIWRGEDLIFERVNDTYQKLFPGIPLEGIPFENALPQRILRDYPEIFRKILRTGEPFSILEQYTPIEKYAGGPLEDHFYNVNFVRLINRDGSAYGVYQHTVDITSQVEARKSKEGEKSKLEAIFEDSPAGLALFKGREAIFEKINIKWKNFVSEREFLGRSYKEVYPELASTGLFETIQKVFDTGVTFRAKEMLVDLKYFDFSLVRVLDGAGNPYGVFCHALDVTDNKILAESLKSALVTRDVFLGIASHELLTPITSLKLQVQLSKKMFTTNGGEAFTREMNLKFFDTALSQIQRLAILVNDMLDVSRISAGRLVMNKTETNLSDLVKEVMDRYVPQLRAVGSTFTHSIQENVIAVIDPLRIDQVMTNLFTNVFKYAAGSDVTLEVKLENRYAVVRLKDKGPGIKADSLERIFGRFERATSEKNISGMGLGLYICEQIIEGHEGTIEVESKEGEGTCFCFKVLAHQNV